MGRQEPVPRQSI